MSQKNVNIYENCRKASGFTQNHAAELLNISVRSLAAYESYERRVPNDVLKKMIEIYDSPLLAYQHLQTVDEINFLPDIDLKDLSGAILKLQKEVNDFIRCRDDMLDITCDGTISEGERPRWDAIVKELDDIFSAILSVKFTKIN